MKKKEWLEVRRVWGIWRAVEEFSEEEVYILEVLADGKGEKNLRIQNAFEVSSATAYRYIEGVLQKIRNILIENE